MGLQIIQGGSKDIAPNAEVLFMSKYFAQSFGEPSRRVQLEQANMARSLQRFSQADLGQMPRYPAEGQLSRPRLSFIPLSYATGLPRYRRP